MTFQTVDHAVPIEITTAVSGRSMFGTLNFGGEKLKVSMRERPGMVDCAPAGKGWLRPSFSESFASFDSCNPLTDIDPNYRELKSMLSLGRVPSPFAQTALVRNHSRA